MVVQLQCFISGLSQQRFGCILGFRVIFVLGIIIYANIEEQIKLFQQYIEMLEKSFFRLKPQNLVRMSKDDIINQYDIFPIKIGEGNDAVVYKAKQNLEYGQWRAVKKIHRKYVDKQQYLVTQIGILRKLDHPGILKIFEVFDDSEYIFIVTELCQGNSLLRHLQTHGYFEQLEARQTFRRIVQIISYCHSNKIMHRDIKPQNMVYTGEAYSVQSLRLIDFGMSFKWQSQARIQIKNTFSSNKVVGTIYYMAPQIRNDTYDHRVDIWSAGVILFLLLTGELPFDQDTDQQIEQAIRQRRVPYERMKSKGCTPQVIDLLKGIFESQMKRMSIQQILNHPWMKLQTKPCLHRMQQLSFDQNSLQKQFQDFSQFKAHYNNEHLNMTSSCSQVNWMNIYEFLRQDTSQRTTKIYLSYRLSNCKIQKYIKMFDSLKLEKKQQIHLLSLYQKLRDQYCQLFLKTNDNLDVDSPDKGQKNVRSSKRRGSFNFSDNKVSKTTKTVFSVKSVYNQLLRYFESNRHQLIGYTQFIAWVSDYQEFDVGQLEFLRTQLKKNKSVSKSAFSNPQFEIELIHKVIRNRFLKKKRKISQEFDYPTNFPSLKLLQSGDSEFSQVRNRKFPNLRIQVKKQLQNISQVNINCKKPAKKTIKQNIWQSISPTFARKNATQNSRPQTDRIASQGNIQINEEKSPNSGFLFGLQRIIQQW